MRHLRLFLGILCFWILLGSVGSFAAALTGTAPLGLHFGTLSRYDGLHAPFTPAPFCYRRYDYPPADGEGRVVIFLYHHLVETMTEEDDPDSVTTREKFEADMVSLLEAGLVPLSLEDWYDGRYETDRDYFVITFDDGYRSNYEIAYPILSDYGIPAEIFLCTGYTERDNHFTFEEGREMEKSGLVGFGSHTTLHIRANTLPLDGFMMMERTAYETIRTLLQPDAPHFFSYPNSACSQRTVEALYAIGVKAQFVQFYPAGYASWGRPEYRLIKRMSVRYDSDVCELAARFFGGEE